MRLRAGMVVMLLVVAAICLVVVVRRLTTDYGSLTLPSPLPSAAPSGSEVLLAVGDVASCYSPADDAVADLASRLPGTIALLGDTAYEYGSADEFQNCFDPSWGPMKSRIRPTTGGHEYQTHGASGYFDYFGAVAGRSGPGLVFLRPGRVAHRGAELELPAGELQRRMETRSPGWRRTWPRIPPTACSAIGITRAGAPAATDRRT